MFETSEIVGLAVALIMLPAIALARRRVSVLAGRVAFLIAYLSVVAALTFTVVEGIPGLPGEWLNAAEHLSYAVAGIAFCLATWKVRGAVLEEAAR